MRPVCLVFLGPTGAGKSTVGEILRNDHGWRYYDEIGRRFYEELILQNEILDGAQIPVEIDRQILKAELDRDRHLIEKNENCIIESWHPGNLAYADTRGTILDTSELTTIQTWATKILEKYECFCQPLTIDDLTILRRGDKRSGKLTQTQLDFYKKVYHSMLYWADELEIPKLPEIDCSDISPLQVSHQILEHVGRWN